MGKIGNIRGFLYGIAFGAGGPIPGISSGSMAIFLNIYEDFFQQINIENIKKRKLVDKKLTTEEQIKCCENDISMVKSKLEKMYMDLLDGKITNEIYENIFTKLNTEITIKTEQLQGLKKNNNTNSEENKKDIKEIVKEFLKTNCCDRKTILRIVNKIEIHQDKQVDIYFNFKELSDFAPTLEGCKFKFNCGTA